MSNLQRDFTAPGTSVSRQRAAIMPQGGLKIEAGCWTKIASTSICVPTDLQYCAAIMCGSCTPNTPPEITAGYIGALSDGSAGDVLNYVAFGW